MHRFLVEVPPERDLSLSSERITTQQASSFSLSPSSALQQGQCPWPQRVHWESRVKGKVMPSYTVFVTWCHCMYLQLKRPGFQQGLVVASHQQNCRNRCLFCTSHWPRNLTCITLHSSWDIITSVLIGRKKLRTQVIRSPNQDPGA